MMKPLRQGELDSLCSIYAVVNAMRLCCGASLSLTSVQAVFRHILRDVSGNLAHIACHGSTGEDVWRYMRVGRKMVRERYDVDFVVRYREYASFAKLEEAVAAHLAEPNSAAIISVDRHSTVVKAVHGEVWELHDSWGYKYLHCKTGKVTRQKPMLRALPELEVVLVKVNEL